MRHTARRFSWTWVAGVIGGIFMAAPTGYAFGHGRASSAAQFDQPPLPAARVTVFPGAHINWSGAGRYTVPDQAPPGVYLVAAGKSVFGCTWMRRSADDNKPKSEIETGTFNAGASGTVTIARSDAVFELAGDCWWAKP